MLKYFVIYLFLEVIISVNIASFIGGIMTFVELLLSAFLGIIIFKNFQFSILQSFSMVYHGEISQEDFVKANIGSMVGANLLIVPGFFTDIIGLLLQIPEFVILFAKFFKPKIDTDFQNNTCEGENDEIIDVEVIDYKHNSYK